MITKILTYEYEGREPREVNFINNEWVELDGIQSSILQLYTSNYNEVFIEMTDNEGNSAKMPLTEDDFRMLISFGRKLYDDVAETDSSL